MTKPTQPITEALVDQLRARAAVGLEKYGVTLDRQDIDLEGWLQHMLEEMLDGAGYAMAAMRKVRGLAAQEAAAWMPMESAPFGTEVVRLLVEAADKSEKRVFAAVQDFSSLNDDWRWLIATTGGKFSVLDSRWRPTGWTPLYASPTPAAATGLIAAAQHQQADPGPPPYADEMTNGECADKLQSFIDVIRENNPKGWPGGIIREVERAVYVLRNPPRTPFICECKRSPARGHNGRGGDGGNVLDKLLATVPMPDLPTTLRGIADRITVAANNPSHHGGHRGALDFVKREVGMLRIAADRVHDAISAQPKNADGGAVAWIRYCSDGTYEGPIHDSQMGDIRRRSGTWTPLGVIGTAAATRADDALPAPKPVPKCSRCGSLTDLVCGSAECGNRNPSI